MAAAAARMGRTRLRKEITAGRLIARKVGRRTVIQTAELERWLRNLLPVEARSAAT